MRSAGSIRAISCGGRQSIASRVPTKSDSQSKADSFPRCSHNGTVRPLNSKRPANSSIYTSRAVVGSVSLDAGESERRTARVMRTPLYLIERNLDNELGAHVHDVSFAANLARQQLLRLPLEDLVRHSLERLSQHHEPARHRI